MQMSSNQTKTNKAKNAMCKVSTVLQEVSYKQS